jgi:hypothetical protein
VRSNRAGGTIYIRTVGKYGIKVNMTDDSEKIEPREPRKENPIFTIWVHTGYAVLILSMIAWMVYMEFFM